jgi:hypothetical protein
MHIHRYILLQIIPSLNIERTEENYNGIYIHKPTKTRFPFQDAQKYTTWLELKPISTKLLSYPRDWAKI